MTNETPAVTAPLPKYFDIEENGDDWYLYCKQCGKGWSLRKTNDHAGNTLQLLNHARSHKPQS